MVPSCSKQQLHFLKLTVRTCQDAPSQKEPNLPNIYFQVPSVSFREGIVIQNTNKNIPPGLAISFFLKISEAFLRLRNLGYRKTIQKNLLETIDHEGVPDVEEPPKTQKKRVANGVVSVSIVLFWNFPGYQHKRVFRF